MDDMKKILNTNWFWIIFIIVMGLMLEFTTSLDVVFLLSMIGVWAGTVFYHECGHWFFAKVRKMELFMISSLDRKSTRLNSSHVAISYAVFCLKKKKESN